MIVYNKNRTQKAIFINKGFYFIIAFFDNTYYLLNLKGKQLTIKK
jgi:hypothetical protein